MTAAVSEMLLQSHELATGLLRFFPGTRTNESVAFERLRANGGFLVSAFYEPGSTPPVQEVEIESTAGVICSFVSPFGPTTRVHVTKLIGSAPITLTPLETKGHYSFGTTVGGRYAITSEALPNR